MYSKKLITLLLIICLAETLWAQQKIPAHDPVMIRQNGVYYLFCTGQGIKVWSSSDMADWKADKPVFDKPPRWAVDAVPGFNNQIWAPDISYFNGLYYLFYAVSAFGKNTSCIGVATNPTLDIADPDYQWTDHGKVIQSLPGKTNWNAIDPNLITDKNGTPYLALGSFRSGLKIVRLTQDRLHLAGTPVRLPTLATRLKDTLANAYYRATDEFPVVAGENAIEAPFIFRKGSYFYLFASIDYCCRGPQSTYKMIVGRSKKLLGAYVDKQRIPLKSGGGSILLTGNKDWYGVGHNAVCEFDGADYLIFHGYDAADKGRSKLRVEKLKWEKGWPVITKKISGITREKR